MPAVSCPRRSEVALVWFRLALACPTVSVSSAQAWLGHWVWHLASPTLPAPACPVTKYLSASRSQCKYDAAGLAFVRLLLVGVPTIPRAMGGSILLPKLFSLAPPHHVVIIDGHAWWHRQLACIPGSMLLVGAWRTKPCRSTGFQGVLPGKPYRSIADEDLEPLQHLQRSLALQSQGPVPLMSRHAAAAIAATHGMSLEQMRRERRARMD